MSFGLPPLCLSRPKGSSNMHIVKFHFYVDFGQSNDFLVVHSNRESYDDDNPPQDKLDRRPSNKTASSVSRDLCPAVRYCNQSLVFLYLLFFFGGGAGVLQFYYKTIT